MRLHLLTLFALATQHINGASLPDTDNALNILEEPVAPRAEYIASPDHTLERRKGGGGRGGGSSGGSSSGGRSSGGGGGGSTRTSSTSSLGGSTRQGSGPTRSYGRGGYYGGGAAVPYQAGQRTKKGLLAGALIAPAALLVIMPGLWLYSVYPYHYNNPYRFYNRTANATNDGKLDKRQNNQQGANQTLPVICLCQEYSVCGCDENTDQSYLDDLIGNGSYAALNKSLVTVSQVNGTRTLVLNGSLPNGTTAPGGTDDAGVSLGVGKYAGYYALALAVLYGVML